MRDLGRPRSAGDPSRGKAASRAHLPKETSHSHGQPGKFDARMYGDIANRTSNRRGAPRKLMQSRLPIYLTVTKLTDGHGTPPVAPVAAKIRKSEMTKRASVICIIGAVIIGGICGVSVWTYLRNCHGLDACAAQSAESHERDKPSEPR